MRKTVIPIALAATLAIAGLFVTTQEVAAPQPLSAAIAALKGSPDASASPLIDPVADFRTRATLKHYGSYITPDTSPVQNDRFTGYHTGVDAEFTDTDEPIAVVAVADGTIRYRGWVKGYGGVLVIQHMIGDIPVLAIYGHVDPVSITDADRVRAGEQIAVLGDGYSQQTDGVRKHLHFSLSLNEQIDFRGYVQDASELAGWLDPLDYLP